MPAHPPQAFAALTATLALAATPAWAAGTLQVEQRTATLAVTAYAGVAIVDANLPCAGLPNPDTVEHCSFTGSLGDPGLFDGTHRPQGAYAHPDIQLAGALLSLRQEFDQPSPDRIANNIECIHVSICITTLLYKSRAIHFVPGIRHAREDRKLRIVAQNPARFGQIEAERRAAPREARLDERITGRLGDGVNEISGGKGRRPGQSEDFSIGCAVIQREQAAGGDIASVSPVADLGNALFIGVNEELARIAVVECAKDLERGGLFRARAVE